MQKSKILDVIKTFEAKDYRRVKDLLNSPFFNKNEELIPFFEYLHKHSKHFDSKKLDREEVYKSVFPKHKYDEKHLGYLQSDLLKMIEKYLVHSNIEQNEFDYYELLAKDYHERSLDKHFNQNLNKAESLQNKNPYRDSNFYYHNYKLANTWNQHYESLQNRKFDNNIQKIIDNLDHFYLIHKLKASCEMLSRQNIISGEYEIRFLQNILQYIEQHNGHEPAVLIYYQIYLMFTEEDQRAHFEKLIQLLNKHNKIFPFVEIRDMYRYGINYAIKKVNQGHTEYFFDLFELYKIILQERLAYEANFLSQFTYKNIVEVALRLKEYDWCQDFMKQYKEDLDPSLKDNAYAYNNAKLYHHQGNFKEALRQSLMVEYNDVFYALGTRILQLKIYFETDDIEPLLTLLDSFKVYLKRNKLISNSAKEPYFNLLKYVHKATRIPYGDTAKFESLIKDIKTTKNVLSINWLIDEIRKKA